MATSRTGTATWKRIRANIIKQCIDEGRTRCPTCQAQMDFEQSGQPNSVEVDHIIPHALGGADSITNSQAMCRTCNRRKGKGNTRKPHPIVRTEPHTLIQW